MVANTQDFSWSESMKAFAFGTSPKRRDKPVGHSSNEPLNLSSTIQLDLIAFVIWNER